MVNVCRYISILYYVYQYIIITAFKIFLNLLFEINVIHLIFRVHCTKNYIKEALTIINIIAQNLIRNTISISL